MLDATSKLPGMKGAKSQKFFRAKIVETERGVSLEFGKFVALISFSGKDSFRQCDQKKIAKCLWKLPKIISQEKLYILTPLQKWPKNVGDLGKFIAVKGFKNLPKVQ